MTTNILTMELFRALLPNFAKMSNIITTVIVTIDHKFKDIDTMEQFE